MQAYKSTKGAYNMQEITLYIDLFERTFEVVEIKG